MPNNTFHFLNVKEGDCSIIEHNSGHTSVIDVCNARKGKMSLTDMVNESISLEKLAGKGNYQQKKHPVNPIEYLKKFGITNIFRFILTHPDMDHMDGIKDLFESFNPANFYDTNNNETKNFSDKSKDYVISKYREMDWLFYKDIKKNNPQRNPKRQVLYAGDDEIYRTKDWNGNRPGDSFYILSPTPEVEKIANETGNYNDLSYIILYKTILGNKILLCGDAQDESWKQVLKSYGEIVKDIDLMIAPHHGRDSVRNYDFLEITKPKLTFFGNAKSEYLAYDKWKSRNLAYITNNQADCMVVDTSKTELEVYVTNKVFANKINEYTFYKQKYDAHFLIQINDQTDYSKLNED